MYECDVSPYVDDVTLSVVVLVLVQDDVTVSSIELIEDQWIYRNLF